MQGLAFEGLRVLDISEGIAGPYCARWLADFGADVIKMERPGRGDRMRSFGPFPEDTPHSEKSLSFLLLNLNKRGITLNLETETGQHLFKELVKKANVVVEGFKPGYLASLGLDYLSLSAINPRLIMASLTWFGQTGPYAGYEGEEIVAYATGAVMSISGTQDREPLMHGGFQAQYESGLNAAAITAVALLGQELTGQGQHIDLSINEVVSSTLVINQPSYSFIGAIQGRRRPRGNEFGNPMPCKDGYIISQAGGGATWEEIAGFYGRPDLLEPRFADDSTRNRHGEELDAIFLDAIKERSKRELFRSASERRMLLGIVQDPNDLVECPQLAARRFYVEVEHPLLGKVKCPVAPFNATATPYSLRRPAPLLGQHNREIFCDELGLPLEELTRLRELNVI